MKSACLILFAATLSLFYSCNTNDKKTSESTDVEVMDTVYETSNGTNGDSTLHVKNQALLWHIDDSGGLKLKKPTTPGLDTMSVINVIDLINNNYDSIHLDYVKTSHDTVYVHIPHSEMLTERIGNTGAEMFMASAVYSLTALKGIHYVNFDFIEGDHATPGVYDRTYFTNVQ